MAYGAVEATGDKSEMQQLLSWIDCTYRLCTYAIVSSYIEDMTTTVYTTTNMQFVVDQEQGTITTRSETETHVDEMTVPKEYRNSTKKIL